MFKNGKQTLIDNSQKLFNQLIRRSNFYADNIEAFDKKVVNVYILDFALDVNFRFEGTQIEYFTDITTKPDLKIEGDILDFIKAARFGLAKKPIPAGLLKIKGDVSLIQNLQRILIESGIIFEEILGSFVGGPFANQFVNGAKSAVSSLNETMESFLENTKIYIKEDAREFVVKDELSQLDKEIFELSNRVDLLESKRRALFSKKG